MSILDEADTLGAGVLRLSVAGRVYDLDLTELQIVDPPTERASACAQMAWFGALMGDAEGEVENCEMLLKSAVAAQLRANETIAEWKAKAIADSDPDVMAAKSALAEAKVQAIRTRSVYEAWKQKAYTLAALIAPERHEMRMAGGVDRGTETVTHPIPLSTPRTVPTRSKVEKEEGVRAVMAGKRTRTKEHTD